MMMEDNNNNRGLWSAVQWATSSSKSGMSQDHNYKLYRISIVGVPSTCQFAMHWLSQTELCSVMLVCKRWAQVILNMFCLLDLKFKGPNGDHPRV